MVLTVYKCKYTLLGFSTLFCNDLCADVAIALRQPIERISVEMVFRSLYFFHRALLLNPKLQLIPWLVEHYRSMGLVKAVRQRHRRTAARSLDIWADALT